MTIKHPLVQSSSIELKLIGPQGQTTAVYRMVPLELANNTLSYSVGAKVPEKNR